jgi:predicted hydrocarbon binding protein
MSKVFEGVVSARFFPESIDKRITISMNVIPIFCKKKIPFRMNPCPSPPKIEAKEVKENCTEIIPGDPERGYAGFDRPDNERFLTYRYIIDQGILEKGTGKEAIRNVSLRAKTLSTFFDKLRRNMPLSDDLYHKNMKAVGREIGADFVNELETILSRKPTLEEWSDYDASAGMGRFKIIDKKKIVAKNSFNAYKNPSDKPVCVCSFLEGYFEGILKEIWGTTVIVTEISCIGKGDKECVFKIEEK